MTRHVILGAGPAGLNAIETIRQIDPGASITLISDEPAYARMALPYFLNGGIPAGHLTTASPEYLERLRVEHRCGRRAARVDAAARLVHLDDGGTVGFDTLLVATGSSPVKLQIPGADGPGVNTMWTLADALAVRQLAQTGRPAVVLVGGGFIGLIVLNALHRVGWKLTVVERESQILPHMLDRRGAQAAEAWLRARGVEVVTGCTVQEIGGRKKKTVALSNGQELGAHLVLLSAGVQPNVGFLEGSGVRVEHGVVVDERLQSSVPGIYAAGDAAQGPDLLGGPRAVHAIQPTAVDHGRVAGANMAGRECRYAGSLAMNILDVAGLHCTSFGRWRDGADAIEVWNPGRPVYRKLVWEGTRLVGGILLGPVEDTTMLTDVGMLKGLIESRVELGDWKSYLRERPWDLRRAFVASRAAERLLEKRLVGEPAVPRGFHFNGMDPHAGPGPHHADIVGTRPAGFESLPRTPTPGIHKAGKSA